MTTRLVIFTKGLLLFYKVAINNKQKNPKLSPDISTTFSCLISHYFFFNRSFSKRLDFTLSFILAGFEKPGRPIKDNCFQNEYSLHRFHETL